MGLCGGFRCGCGVTSTPATAGAIDGELPSIVVSGSGEPGDPYDLELNDAWAVKVADKLAKTTDWESFVPTFANLTIGNGTFSFFRRFIDGDLRIRGTVTFGTTTAITGLGVRFAHGVAAAAGSRSLGVVWLLDNSAPGNSDDGTCQTTATDVWIYASGIRSLASTAPFTWAENDSIALDIVVAVNP